MEEHNITYEISLQKTSNLNLIMLLVPTANIQAIQGAEEHVKTPQKGNQQKPNYGKP